MMSHDDRAAIDALFRRLDEAARRGLPREPEAEAYIRAKIERNPAYAYYLAQTVIVQHQALEGAEERIADLEAAAAEARSGGGGFLGGLFGSARPAPARRPAPMPATARPARPVSPALGQPAGGGFLAGAAQTAMGVAGGVLLGNMLMGLFEGDEAQAAEPDAGGDLGGDEGGDFDDLL